ncbi:MAG TPA: hypothetical protein VJA21_00945 [Verrucomicrobiae bacterium]
MRIRLSSSALASIVLLALGLAAPLNAQQLRLLSQVDPAQVPAGAGGDSYTPLLSPDGRYVVFVSTANNLLVASNGAVIPMRLPAPLNVYLRDRAYGTNALVSVNLSGVAGGNGDSLPAGLSPDGRFVVFESTANDLVSGDTNNANDVFVRDLVNGTTTLVSAATNGLPGLGASRSPAMTPDGRYVAFVSAVTNLVDRDTNRIPDVFVRDLQNNTTVLASVGAISTAQTGSSEAPEITSDGRYVAFYSSAANLVPGSRIGSDIYIRDLWSNVTILASGYARTAVPSNSVSCFNHTFSADGRYLAYEAAGTYALFGTVLRYSLDTGLTDIVGTNATVSRSAYEDIRSLAISADGRFIAYVANYSTRDGTTTCIKRWDAQTGDSTIVSSNVSDAGVPLGSICDWPALDPSGRYVAFLSSATNMVTNTVVGEYHLYLHDTRLSRRTLLDADTNGVGSSISPLTAPQISADARYAAFDCPDASLVASDRNRDSDVFLRDLQTDHIELISACDPALPTASPNGVTTLSFYSVSGDGRYVLFASEADNIVANDTNGCRDVFVRDLADGTTRLVSAATNGLSADGVSSDHAISLDGRHAAFTSLADNLAPGDTNRLQDVYVQDLQSGATTLVSVNSSGTGSGNKDSYLPIVAAGGRYVLFRSKATNLAAGSYTSGTENLFLRDMMLGTNYALTLAGVKAASMTPDGRFVALLDTPGAFGGTYYIWDTVSVSKATNTTGLTSLNNLAISPDGKRVAYWGASAAVQLYVAELSTGTTLAITLGPVPTATPSIRFSANSQVLVYNKPVSTTNQVYGYDLQAGGEFLVSADYQSGQPANAASDSPVASADGRFIAYRSAAANIVPGDVNGQPDIFLFDRQTGSNTLLSAGQPGNVSPNNRSLMPVFSGDGSTLLFNSWASDLAPRDFNQGSDIFATMFLTAVLLPGSGPGQGPWVSWPWAPDRNYRVEYKDSLNEAAWHELSGSITNLGVKAWLQDPSPAASQRFYRVISY